MGENEGLIAANDLIAYTIGMAQLLPYVTIRGPVVSSARRPRFDIFTQARSLFYWSSV